MPRAAPSRAGSGAAALLLLLAVATPATAQTDPFAPHLRWVHGPTAGSWLPRSLDFVGPGDLLWSAGSVGSPRLMLLAADELPDFTGGSPLVGEDPSIAGAQGTVSIAAGADPTALFSLHQLPTATAPLRTTEVARRAAGPSGALSVVWTRQLALVGNGAGCLALDGTGALVAAAVNDAASGSLRVEWLDAASGALLAGRTLAGSTLRAMELSADGQRLALLAGATLMVFDPTGAMLQQETLPLATNALAMSADGDSLLVGEGTSARLLRWNGNGYGEVFRTPVFLGEAVTRAAISDDGNVFALGWWDQVSGTGVRFQVWSGAALVYEALQTAPGAPLQNFPEAVELTGDGRRAAFGAWGVGDASPELWLVDVPSATALLQVDLPGSVRALALDETGTRVAVAMKHGHANQFASTGEIRLHDTGERDLQLLSGPLAPTLSLATQQPGASRSLFLFGTPGSVPTPFIGSVGTLWIQRSQPLRVFNRAADAGGRSDLNVAPDRIADQVGDPFSVQAAARVGGTLQFSETLLTPPRL